jgi:DNA-binding MarR family transcriptional regulator
MSRTPAKVTQADVARALRAMKAAGFVGKVQIKRDGTIEILPLGGRERQEALEEGPAVDRRREIVL